MVIKCRSSDGEIIEVPRNVISMSINISTFLQDVDLTDEQTHEQPIPIWSVESKTLKKVFEWCEHHANEVENGTVEEITMQNGYYIIPAWDAHFLCINRPELFDIFKAADSLYIRRLFELCSKTTLNELHLHPA